MVNSIIAQDEIASFLIKFQIYQHGFEAGDLNLVMHKYG
jgi:hypothetical protein